MVYPFDKAEMAEITNMNWVMGDRHAASHDHARVSLRNPRIGRPLLLSNKFIVKHDPMGEVHDCNQHPQSPFS
jgi:hypothetical protein